MDRCLSPIFDILELKAETSPDNIAIADKNNTIIYREFLLKVNRCAAWLNLNGIKCGDIIGIMMDRSINMIVAIFSILRAGAAIMPISSSNPKERIEYLLKDSKAKMLITDKSNNNFSVKTLLFSVLEYISYSCSCANYPKICKNDLAYVMYTSGSTGEPKGVLIEYESLFNRIFWQQTKYPIYENDVVLQKTITSFDVSIWEILWWSIAGAHLCLLPPNQENSPRAIINSIQMWRVSAIHFVPTVFYLFLNYIDVHKCNYLLTTLKYIFLSGEQVNKEDIRRFYQLDGVNAKLINLYGPTEATIDVTCFDCINYLNYDKVPIGKAIHNMEIMVLDDKNCEVKQGVVGELCISGIQLARSYLNKDDLTKEKFLYLDNGKRIYKTGDLARILPDGNCEYCGRIDRQVKINGIRIELMEIESQILKLGYISFVIVEVIKNDQLFAFYRSTKEIESNKIRDDLKKVLPSYMIPIKFIFYPDIDLKENGKVNYNVNPKKIL